MQQGWGHLGRCRIALAMAAILVISGCAGSPKNAESTETVQALLDQGRFLEARARLETMDARGPLENVLLGECALAMGAHEEAAHAFYAARVHQAMTPDLEFRVLVGLGDVALSKADGYTAVARFSEAQRVARAVDERDRARVGEARGHLIVGRTGAARELRGRVRDVTVRGLQQLDRQLALVASSNQRVARRPQPRSTRPLRRSRPSGRLEMPPGVLSRHKWRARPLKTSQASRMSRITRVTVHHTGEAKPVRVRSQTQAAARMRAYQSSHVRGRKWADIGYHFMIDPQGRVWEGRPLGWQGAHAGNAVGNVNNVGVCMMGNFDHRNPSAAQRRSLRRVLSWFVGRYDVHPSRIYTHNEIRKKLGLGGTACPGRRLAAQVRVMRGSIRRDVGQAGPRMLRIPEVTDREAVVAVAGCDEKPGFACSCCEDDAAGPEWMSAGTLLAMNDLQAALGR